MSLSIQRDALGSKYGCAWLSPGGKWFDLRGNHPFRDSSRYCPHSYDYGENCRGDTRDRG